ncbi:MAG: tRNA (guanosine(37)-N1)-methyltransferase TrmD [bacterium]|nr:tRNA (guanosine(37)-N1)-methyltransferase TrmD [bacterium]
MRFDILTIFPNILDSYIKESILKIAQAKEKIKINTYDIREFTKDKHKKIDDTPYGGGPGMVMMVQPIYDCLKSIPRMERSRIIMLDPAGPEYTQKTAASYSKVFDQIILICGRYEGFDDRVHKLVDERLSIGKYILSGGELPALIIVESVTRLLPGVLGDAESIVEETYSENLDYVEYPQYTRPATFKTDGGKEWNVPNVLQSGDHGKIDKWREENHRKND